MYVVTRQYSRASRCALWYSFTEFYCFITVSKETDRHSFGLQIPVFWATLKYTSIVLIFLFTAIGLCPEQSVASDMPNVFLNRDFKLCLLAYSMEHNHSREANQFSASQEIPTFFGTRRFITAYTSVHHLSLS
jgi:hypothetical protein